MPAYSSASASMPRITSSLGPACCAEPGDDATAAIQKAIHPLRLIMSSRSSSEERRSYSAFSRDSKAARPYRALAVRMASRRRRGPEARWCWIRGSPGESRPTSSRSGAAARPEVAASTPSSMVMFMSRTARAIQNGRDVVKLEPGLEFVGRARRSHFGVRSSERSTHPRGHREGARARARQAAHPSRELEPSLRSLPVASGPRSPKGSPL